jgi:DNA modification methylase
MELNQIIHADVMQGIPLPNESVNCIVTSPSYWGLRDYGVEGQIGLEKTPEEYVDKMVQIFREIKRVLRKDGTVFLNLGDSYCNPSQPGGKDPTIGNRNIGKSKYRSNMPTNLKPKDLIGIPWRVAFALQADGWWLRQDIIWQKPNPMPESVTDRCTKSHEYIFLLTKSAKYYFNNETI